jgi:putative acetyltransferase
MMVRRYNPEDLPAMLALFGRSVREIACHDYAPEQVAAWAPELPDIDGWSKRLSNQMVFVCENQGQIAGFASVESDGHLGLLYVHPEAQRRGVASVLRARILEWAMARKLTNVFTEASITARPFFERCGFRVVRSQTVQAHGVSMANLRMERAL